jgi:hypothetical protein
LVRELYQTVVPDYVEMVLTNAQSGVAGEAEKPALLSRRQAVANRIVSAWGKFVGGLRESELEFAGVRLQSVRLLGATYARAQLYAGKVAAGEVAPLSDPAIQVHQLLLAEFVRPNLRPLSFEFVRIAVSQEGAQREQQMREFEENALRFFEARAALSLAVGDEYSQKAVALRQRFYQLTRRSTDLGLLSCTEPLNGNNSCGEGRAQNAYYRILTLMPAKETVQLQGIREDVRRARYRRVLPAA